MRATLNLTWTVGSRAFHITLTKHRFCALRNFLVFKFMHNSQAPSLYYQFTVCFALFYFLPRCERLCLFLSFCYVVYTRHKIAEFLNTISHIFCLTKYDFIVSQFQLTVRCLSLGKLFQLTAGIYAFALYIVTLKIFFCQNLTLQLSAAKAFTLIHLLSIQFCIQNKNIFFQFVLSLANRMFRV